MSSSYQDVKLEKSAQVAGLLDSRHILDDEVRMVIHQAESTGEKLYQPESNKFLAKRRIGEATFYAEYSMAGDKTYKVHTAYSHRAKLEE